MKIHYIGFSVTNAHVVFFLEPAEV